MANESTAVSEIDLEFDPFSEEMMSDPYEKYRLLRQHAPVYFNKTRSFWAVTKYEESRRVLKEHETFTIKDGVELDGTGPEFFGGTNSNLLILDPPAHKQIRKILNPAFTPAAARKIEDAVNKIADELIDAFIAAGEADFARDFAWPLPIEAISVVLGVPKQDRPWVTAQVMAAFKREPGVTGLPTAAVKAAVEVKTYFGSTLDEHRANPTDDFLSVLAQSNGVNGEPLTSEEVGGLCLLLFAAGIITTASFLSNSLYLLVDKPDERMRLIHEPEIVPRAVDELWRLESPVQNTCRTAIKDTTLGGVQVRAGDRVAVFPGSANRDEDIWENSEQLDFDREQKRNLVFGDGVHVCVGQPLARLEGQIGLTKMLGRIPDYELAGPVERTDRVNERGLVSLPVTFAAGR